MTISVVTTAAHVVNASATTSVTFTPAANSLVGVFAGGDAGDGSTDEALTVASTGHTMTRQARSNGGVGGVMELWTTPISSSASMTVNVTDNKGSTDKAVKVVWWTDSSGSTPTIGAVATDNTRASSLAVTSTATGTWAWMWVFGVADFGAVTGQTLQDHVDNDDDWDGGDRAGLYSLNALSTGSGQSMSLSSGETPIQQLVVEIKPPSGGSDHAGAVTPTATATLAPAATHTRAAATSGTAAATLAPTPHQGHAAAISTAVTVGLTPAATHIRGAAIAAAATATLAPAVTQDHTAATTATVTATLAAGATPVHPAAITADVVPALFLSPSGHNQGAIAADVASSLEAAETHTRAAAVALTAVAGLITAASSVGAHAISSTVIARMAATILANLIRDITVTYGQPELAWAFGPPELAWHLGTVET